MNEEKTLPTVLNGLPSADELDGVDTVDVLVIDDGSEDRTAEIAREHGCHVIRHKVNRGLGQAFGTGLEYALRNEYDVLVNTDGDNQYPGREVPKIVKPVTDESADMVIGDRNPASLKRFSPTKRFFQWLGSATVRLLTSTDVPDTVSGFRAYNRDAMKKLHVTTRFSYVIDTIMQASKKGLKIESVPVETNKVERPSRLFSNMFEHVTTSAYNLLRVYALHEPLKTFAFLSMFFLAPGVFLGGRYLYFFFTVGGSGHIQSLIAMAVLLLAGFLTLALGIISELLKTNRLLIEQAKEQTK